MSNHQLDLSPFDRPCDGTGGEGEKRLVVVVDHDVVRAGAAATRATRYTWFQLPSLSSTVVRPK